MEKLLKEILSELKSINEYIDYKKNQELGKIRNYQRLPGNLESFEDIKNKQFLEEIKTKELEAYIQAGLNTQR